VTLDVQPGEFFVVIGPSGSGKSTLLRCVAGLETPDAGTIAVGGRDITRAAPGARDVAMVFQEDALYPHLDVRRNISFPLEAKKVPRDEVAHRVARAAEQLHLGPLLARYPRELSGGERRRAALARAMVREPATFLMDEPLANLDPDLRASVRDEIVTLQRDLGTTTLYVTHDRVEAMSMGARVAVLRAGVVEQVGTPMELYAAPSSTFVARFLGRHPMNLFDPDLLGRIGAKVCGVRPEVTRLVAAGAGRADCRVVSVESLGNETLVRCEIDTTTLLAEVPNKEAPAPGDVRGIDFDVADVHLFDQDGRAAR